MSEKKRSTGIPQSGIGMRPRNVPFSPGDELAGITPSGKLRASGQPGQINKVLAIELSGVALLLASCGSAVIKHLEKQGIPSENISQIYEFPNVDGFEANNLQDNTSQINFLMYTDNNQAPHMVFLTEDNQDISYDREVFLYYIGTADKISSVSIVTANEEDPGLNWQDDPNKFSVAFQMDLTQPLSRTEFDRKINDPNIPIDSFASRVSLTNQGTDESIEITFPLPDTISAPHQAKLASQLRVLLVGDRQNGVKPTMTPEIVATITVPATPTEVPIPADVQLKMTKLDEAGITGYEYRDGKIYSSGETVISVDELDVIMTPSETGLSWWNAETGQWMIVNPINPETYPPVYLEHWNSLATREPVSVPTAEDIAFNNFQVETYRDFFPSIQTDLANNPLWQAFFEANGSDFTAMSQDQIYQASLLYGQTSHEVIMPIVLMEAQNQANSENWKFTYQTSDGLGIIHPFSGSNTSEKIQHDIDLIRNKGYWGFDQNFFGLNINIDSIPVRKISGTMQALFRIPGVDPGVEVGLIISFNDGQNHLAFSVPFQEVKILPGNTYIQYWDLNTQPILITSPTELTFPPLQDKWALAISFQQLQDDFIGTEKTLIIGEDMAGSTGAFSPNSGLQLLENILY